MRSDWRQYAEQLIQRHRLCTETEFDWNGRSWRCSHGVFNPGLAESSRLLADYISGLPLTGKRVLDAGCGCGLQTIAALFAGAEEVTAFDVNFDAVLDTVENVDRAAMTGRVLVFCADSMPLTEDFDVIVLNPPFFSRAPPEAWQRAFYDGNRAFLREVARGCSNGWRGEAIVSAIGGTLTPEELKHHLDTHGSGEWREVQPPMGAVGAGLYYWRRERSTDVAQAAATKMCTRSS